MAKHIDFETKCPHCGKNNDCEKEVLEMLKFRKYDFGAIKAQFSLKQLENGNIIEIKLHSKDRNYSFQFTISKENKDMSENYIKFSFRNSKIYKLRTVKSNFFIYAADEKHNVSLLKGLMNLIWHMLYGIEVEYLREDEEPIVSDLVENTGKIPEDCIYDLYGCIKKSFEKNGVKFETNLNENNSMQEVFKETEYNYHVISELFPHLV